MELATYKAKESAAASVAVVPDQTPRVQELEAEAAELVRKHEENAKVWAKTKLALEDEVNHFSESFTFANVRRKVEKLSVKIEENEKRLADQAKGKSKDTAELDNVREELDKAYVSLCL